MRRTLALPRVRASGWARSVAGGRCSRGGRDAVARGHPARRPRRSARFARRRAAALVRRRRWPRRCSGRRHAAAGAATAPAAASGGGRATCSATPVLAAQVYLVPPVSSLGLAHRGRRARARRCSPAALSVAGLATAGTTPNRRVAHRHARPRARCSCRSGCSLLVLAVCSLRPVRRRWRALADRRAARGPRRLAQSAAGRPLGATRLRRSRSPSTRSSASASLRS